MFRLTLQEINLLSITHGEIREAEYEDRVCDLYLGASLNSYAYNDPKKMPKLKSLLPKKSSVHSQDEENRKALQEEGARVGMRVPI